jgi:GNAT superfamily N-acetyltransferase
VTEVKILAVNVAGTYDLRRRVLRGGDPSSDVTFAQDTVDGAFHLAALDEDGTVVGVASFYPVPTPWRPDAAAPWQLRGMAVDPSMQGGGVGRQLLLAAVERLRADGADVLWANVRDSAEGFYARMGWETVGEGFLSVGIPHHVAVLDLSVPS